jgi:hypothetical protein
MRAAASSPLLLATDAADELAAEGHSRSARRTRWSAADGASTARRRAGKKALGGTARARRSRRSALRALDELPKGFLASGVRAGIRKKRPTSASSSPDGANAAAVFTQNKFQAAPVVLSKAALKKSGRRVKAVVVNAGCANAVTGKRRTRRREARARRAAELLRCDENEIFSPRPA